VSFQGGAEIMRNSYKKHAKFEKWTYTIQMLLAGILFLLGIAFLIVYFWMTLIGPDWETITLHKSEEMGFLAAIGILGGGMMIYRIEMERLKKELKELKQNARENEVSDTG